MVFERGVSGTIKPKTATTIPTQQQSSQERGIAQRPGYKPSEPMSQYKPGETVSTSKDVPPTYSKAQIQGQVAKGWVVGLKTYVQQRANIAGAKNRIDPNAQYVMNDEGPTWSKGQILTGAQIQSQYNDVQNLNRTSFMGSQKNKSNLLSTISEFHPDTKVSVKTDVKTGEKRYEFSFPYPGAEHYKTYEKMVTEHRNEYLAGRFFTSPTLNVDYTLSGNKQERTDILVKWLHGVRGSPEGGFDFGRMASTISSSPFVSASLLAGGSAIYGAGRGALTGYFIGSKAGNAAKILTAAELGVGGYFGYEAAKNIKTVYEKEGFGAALGTGISTGLIIGGGIAGFKAGTQYKFTRGLPKGSSGYTSTEWGAHKGTVKNVNKLENISIKKFGGKTTYEPVYKNKYIGEDFNWFQRENVGTKLVGMSPEQANIFRGFENYRFMAQGVYGDVATFTGARGMIGQKDFDVSFGKAETMRGQPKDYLEFSQKQATMEYSELFGGSTYKASGAHDVDQMVHNLSQFNRRIEYGAGKLNVKTEDMGMDIKPYVKPGKVVSASGALKQKPYTVSGRYGDIDVMRWSETASRLGDASKFPASRRVKLNQETGMMEAKDINSYLNMVARLHYQAGGQKPTGFDMGGFLKTGKAWEENFVQMGTYEEKALFDTKTLPEKWANVKNTVYKEVLPKKLQLHFQERNYQKIMGFNEVARNKNMISEMPSSPNVPSARFNILFTPSGYAGPVRKSGGYPSSSRYVSASFSLGGYPSQSSKSSKSVSSSLFSVSPFGGYPSRSASVSMSPSSLSPSPYKSPSRYSSKYSYSPSVSSGYKSSSVPYPPFFPGIPMAGGSNRGRSDDYWGKYFRKRTFNIGSLPRALGMGFKPMKMRGR